MPNHQRSMCVGELLGGVWPNLSRPLCMSALGRTKPVTRPRRLAGLRSVPRDEWPTQARFWLEWACSSLLNSVIPTGAVHRERGDLRRGEAALSKPKGICCWDVTWL